MDESTRKMVAQMFAGREIAIRCAKCKADIIVKTVAEVAELGADALKQLGMASWTVSSAHRC